MASRVCWSCERFANMSNVHQGVRRKNAAIGTATYACDHCNALSLAVVSVYNWRDSVAEKVELSQPEDVQWLPSQADGKAFPDVPQPISEAADEVHRCLSVRANRAAVALSRAVVEATAKYKGITSGRIFDKIEELHARGLIREHVREMAHEVRLGGNEVAHGDLDGLASGTEDARDVVALMDEILNEVFQSPARTERVRAARKARNAPTP